MAEIFTPFLAAFILAYALRPVALWLEQHRLPKSLAACLAMIFGLSLLAGIVILLISLISQEIPLIKTQLPEWIEKTQIWLAPKLAEHNIVFDWVAIKAIATQKISALVSDNAKNVVNTTLGTILSSGGSILSVLIDLVLTLFVLFYLLLDWNHFFQYLKKLIPLRFQTTAQHLCAKTDGLLSQYLRGQILVILVMAIYYCTGLSIVGVRGAIALGVFTAIVVIIPYLGFWLGFILALLSALLQFGLGAELIGVLVVFGIGQMLEGFFLTPRLVGERIGLHPVAVLFALLIFGKLFGFFGVLLALPASAVSLVLIQFAWSLYLESSWYQGSKK